MNQPLALESVDASSVARLGGREMTATGSRHAPARPMSVTSFVERRRATASETCHAIRSPMVLGFAGMVSGLVLSAVLILGIALIMALLEVRWASASHYSVVAVLAVFGGVVAVLYWDLGETATRLMEKIEPAVERRVHYLHLSSLNAFENLRTLDRPACPAPAQATANVLPMSRPAPVSRIATPRRAPVSQPFYSEHAAKARAPMNSWAWDRAGTA